MSITQSIVVGVVSGVVTSALLYALGKIWLALILPWYQRITYQGVDVAGSWSWKSSSEGESTAIEMMLTQNAHKLIGQVFITKKNGEKVLFTAKGSIWEGYISLNMKTPDRKILSFANTLLRVCSGGRELQGQLTFRNINKDDVTTTGVILKRA